jgi:hypothetical protein
MNSSRRAVLAAVLTVGLAPAAFAQNPPPGRLRATVLGLDGDALRLTVRGGATVTANLLPDTIVTAVVPTTLDAIKPGSFIGTAAMPGPNGTLIAIEVHVFPESMRGLGEGHRPYDLQPESTMTNGTVGTVTGTSGPTLTVAYKGGEKAVTVPPDAPIVTFEPGGRDLLAKGAHAIAFTVKAADGSLVIPRILVGKDGFVPPM